ncbi:mirror-image polydactyly gene 1 protein isoform X4 [Fukomys damarensis]|uniref:mirror-image polydactyly gene 1 protein isoform X4 n=1 Tax=Fukomys damarensis TaxID=885580 RepID=UPI0005402360|nr:mirror-image polydactyly gene 1 protein isoform X4 [Fukomys damarensis]
MEGWSKGIAHIHIEQDTTGRNKSTQLDEHLAMESEGSLHQKSSDLGNEVTDEDTELPEQISRSLLVIGPNPDDEMTEKCNIMEYRKNDLHYEYIIPYQVTSDVNKETVAFLLKELDILRTSNKKLQEKLTKENKEQKKLKFKLELQEKAMEATIAEKTAALVEEVYFAQRERDEAVMSRLQLAIEERDEAIAQAKRMEMSLKMLENINPEENDMTLQELLNRINNADTGIAIQKNGAIIVDRIYRSKECKKRITAEEMNAVIEERDAALSQVKLLSMHQAKETAVEQYKKLEEEIQTLRVYYSLHKSLSQEENLKDQFNHTLSTYEEALKNRESIVSITQQQNEELAAQLQQTLTEQANMELQLQRAVEASQVANEKAQKLERLVDVLRKKVGTGTLRRVI